MSMFSSPELKSPPTKEELKLQARREANEQRRFRFMDARRRIIGLDIDGLNLQVQEKNQATADRADQDRLEKLKILQIEAILETAAKEEADLKAMQKRELKKSWDNAICYKNSQPVSPPLDPQLAGSSAAQVFPGEDRSYWERIEAQRRQQSQWVQEQLSEKAYIQKVGVDDMFEFAAIEKAVDEMRGGAEAEEAEARRKLNLSIKTDNDTLTKIQKENKQRMNDPFDSRRADLLSATSLNILTETPDDACDASGRILRRDMFKGYSESQKKRVWLENEKCRQQKLDMLRQEMSDENDYITQQAMINKAMEAAAYETKVMKGELNKGNTEFLKKQASEQAALRDISNRNKFGSVEPGFFDNFGKSCR